MSFLQDVPLAGAAVAHAFAGSTVPHDTDATYGDFLRPTSDTGKWVDGSALLGRKGLAVINLGTVGAGATDFKCSLLEATDADGGSGAEKVALLTLANAALGTGEKAYTAEIAFDSTVIDVSKFYALGCASKGAEPSTDGVPCSATLLLIDPTYVG